MGYVKKKLLLVCLPSLEGGLVKSNSAVILLDFFSLNSCMLVNSFKIQLKQHMSRVIIFMF